LPTAAPPRRWSSSPRRSCAWQALVPRRIALSGRDSLTPGERRVTDLAAQGMSNKQIAQALFVTLRTVEMHLSNAYRKLEISSREELPAVLGTPGAPAQ
jgi:DNA-binding CsgD family transcriptional regulator